MKRGFNRGQLKLSFEMIFSIILIIIFLSFTVYVVTFWMDLGDKGKIAKFTNDLQDNIDRAWVGQQVSDADEYKLPRKLDLVCFIDFSVGHGRGTNAYEDIYDELELEYFGEGNIVLYPVEHGEGLGSNVLEHINLTKMTEDENPYCVESDKGDISITIKKDYGENWVTLTR